MARRRSRLRNSTRDTPAPLERAWTVQVLRRAAARGVNLREVKRVVMAVLNDRSCAHLPRHITEVSVLLTNDREIHRLNREWRGKDKPTDVLSFALLDDPTAPPAPLLGDLVISIDTTRRQAKEYGVPVGEELLRLLIHGLLHLSGYDHEGVSRTEAERMRRAERRLLPVMGSGSVLMSGRTPRPVSARRSRRR